MAPPGAADRIGAFRGTPRPKLRCRTRCFVGPGNLPELILLSTTGTSGNVSPRNCPGSRLYARRERFLRFFNDFRGALKVAEKRVETCSTARTEVVLPILCSLYRAVSPRVVRGRRAEKFSADGCGCPEQTDLTVSPATARAAYSHFGDLRHRPRCGRVWKDLDPRRCSPVREFEFPCLRRSWLTPCSASRHPAVTH